MENKPRIVVHFDESNAQKDYQYVAKDYYGNWVVGWIVIEQPWYTSESQWTYRMYQNVYGDGGICGGATDLGMSYAIVNPETIRPYNQVAQIECDIDKGFIVLLYRDNEGFEDRDEDLIATIVNKEDIPYSLWNE